MSFFKKLKTWFSVFTEFLTSFFFSQKRSYIESNHPDLKPLTCDEIIEKLQIKEKAQRLGLAGLPLEESTELSGPEQEIIQYFEAERRNNVQTAQFNLNKINQKINELNVIPIINRALQYGEEYERKANTELSDAEQVLRKKQIIADTHRAELEKFKKEHGLIRLTKDSSKSEKLISYLIIGLIFILEGILNANLFSSSIDGGLIEGFFWATTTALFNTAFSLIVGNLILPYAFYKKSKIKILGIIISAISLFIITPTICLAIAHIKDSFSDTTENTFNSIAATALESLTSHPFILKDILSWILFTFTMIAAYFVAYKTYKIGESYPGYAKHQHNVSEAEQEHERIVNSLRKNLLEIKTHYLEKLDDAIQIAQNNLQEYQKQIEKKQDASIRLNNWLARSENMLSAVVAAFRTENEIYLKQNSHKKPSYYQETIKPQLLDLPDFGIKEDKSKLLEQEVMLKTLLDQCEPIRAKIQSAHDVKFDHLKPIHQQF